MPRLFVYGTLAPGRANHHILEPLGGLWDEATVKGRLLAEGWGAEMGYPGIVLDAEGEDVEGYMLSSDELAHHWPMLDEFEGEGYERVLTEARLPDAQRVQVYVYALRQS